MRLGRKNSRTTNTIFNFLTSMGGQLISIIMQFVVRTVFISTLGKSYLGISGLFSNILSMLALAELGIGSAILFKLYAPIAHEDHHRIAVLMEFYRRVYRIIGISVAAIGVCLIPFLPILISDYDSLAVLNINARLIFCLYLLQSVSSYLFFAYKSAIIKANQKEYLINIIYSFVTFIGSVLQILCLIIFGKFEIYVLILVGQVIVQNIVAAKLSGKMYPYINLKTDDSISKFEIKEILKDCGALFLYKINQVVLQATDNIVLSMFMGLEMVGLYSNYYVFYTTINTLQNKVYDSVLHSLGNLHTGNNRKREYQIFEAAVLIAAIIGGTAGVGIFVVSDEFITAWIGSDWLLAQPFALLMGLEIFTIAFRKILGRYRTSMGLFQQAKYRPLAGMIINLVVSVGLVNYWGICGVLVGTIAADWTTFMWFDPLIIHKYGFENLHSVSRYYFKLLKHVVSIIAVALAAWLICTNILTGMGWISVVIHAAICGVAVPCVMIAINCRNPEGKYLMNLIKKYVKKADMRLTKGK